MRTVVVALAATALAQPALARDHAHRGGAASVQSHHQLSSHHRRHHQRWGHHPHRWFAQPYVAFTPFVDWQANGRPLLRRPDRAPAGLHGAFDDMVARHAQANGLPESLVHRVIVRESRYNPRATSRGNYGIMQIRLGTARAMGYTGSAAGLLDADTNMTYAVKYLAGAYRAAGGNSDRAVAYYARGYYYQAKAQGFSPYAASGRLAFGSAPAPFAWEPQYGSDDGARTMPRRRGRNWM